MNAGHPERAPLARYRCPCCGHVYDEEKGNPREGFAPGTRWEQIPDDWNCPDCAVREKADFEKTGAGLSS